MNPGAIWLAVLLLTIAVYCAAHVRGQRCERRRREEQSRTVAEDLARAYSATLDETKAAVARQTPPSHRRPLLVVTDESIPVGDVRWLNDHAFAELVGVDADTVRKALGLS